PVIMMSGHATVEAAVEATRLGAHDFIEKPLSLSKLLLTIDNALKSGQSAAPLIAPHRPVEPVEMVGKSAATQKLVKQLNTCAQHQVTVLLRGEPGVGKTHCAKYIHTQSARHSGPFVELRTAVLPDGNQRSLDLFLGKETAEGVQPGLLEQAAEGTLFLDDVGELNDDMQTALYGALTSPVIYRQQGKTGLAVRARIIAASRFDLEQEVRAGRFREDLYHVLNQYPIHILPLREHSEDVTELIQHYVRQFSDQEGLPYRSFTMAAQNRLRNYHWPGNVLELENLIHRLLIQVEQPSIDLEHIEDVFSDFEKVSQYDAIAHIMPEFEMPLRQAREQFEKAYLQYHLSQTEGSVGKVAKLAGMERTHLYRKLRSLGIDTKHLTQSAKDT
ncbi:MAG: sigma-54 dependent transcriptional regulator, partial [Gammaproteobacteria bacterium]|nr:sigma-54 dependent transcriptional regulator [Gammaproteobacteria bacterium]